MRQVFGLSGGTKDIRGRFDRPAMDKRASVPDVRVGCRDDDDDDDEDDDEDDGDGDRRRHISFVPCGWCNCASM